jgi:hypothetical protein
MAGSARAVFGVIRYSLSINPTPCLPQSTALENAVDTHSAAAFCRLMVSGREHTAPRGDFPKGEPHLFGRVE